MPSIKRIAFLICFLSVQQLHAQLPTPVELYDTLEARGFRDPLAVWRISMWETGYLKSSICKTQNNLFGLRGSKGYKTFPDWMTCVSAMKALEDRKYAEYSAKKKGDYYDFIAWWGYKTGYSYSQSDKRYVELIKKLAPPQRD